MINCLAKNRSRLSWNLLGAAMDLAAEHSAVGFSFEVAAKSMAQPAFRSRWLEVQEDKGSTIV